MCMTLCVALCECAYMTFVVCFSFSLPAYLCALCTPFAVLLAILCVPSISIQQRADAAAAHVRCNGTTAACLTRTTSSSPPSIRPGGKPNALTLTHTEILAATFVHVVVLQTTACRKISLCLCVCVCVDMCRVERIFLCSWMCAVGSSLCGNMYAGSTLAWFQHLQCSRYKFHVRA